jgi:2-polyprenyl-3-methyl-5-hydroxy-6-metoxy-1,4-benzoquinol methylase
LKNPDLERVVCPKCGSGDSTVKVTAHDYLYGVPGEFCAVSCNRCGLWFQNPRPTLESLGGIYPTAYIPHETASHPDDASFVRLAARALNPIRRHIRRSALEPVPVQGGRLLELGCASGAKLASLRDAGWEHLYGIELSREAAAKAQSLGFDVRCGLVEEALEEFPDDHFDVVLSSMVVEHLLNPFSVFKQIARKMKPGGQFLFSTIVRDSIDAALYGKYWAGFDFPRHMVFFTLYDLREATAESFKELQWVHQVAPIDYVRSSSWRTRDGKQLLFDKFVRFVGGGVIGQLIFLPLALMGSGCRVSFKCVRR